MSAIEDSLVKPPRSSNFELLRIVAMFLIVAHHYVVNSGVTGLFDKHNPCGNMIFLQLAGAWGKVAINAFVLISGYFMCTSSLTPRRYLKIFLEWAFYACVMYAVMVIAGYEQLTPAGVSMLFMDMFTSVNKLFFASFMWFYLGIPFYNVLVRNLDRAKLYAMTGLLLAFFILPGALFKNQAVRSEVFWYMTVYFVGACIRLHPRKWMDSAGICGVLCLSCLAIACIAIVAGDYWHSQGAKFLCSLLGVRLTNTPMSFALGTSLFLFFRNLRLGVVPAINRIAASMFAVLCIHAASNAVRICLWRDVCNVKAAYSLPLAQLAGHLLLSVVAIMAACVMVDMCRIRWIEKPFFAKFFGGCRHG